ncbi:MAG: AMP-binding protein [Gammaproteobacteria bacterium]|nr:AMP-binding protein [Gammaproteobacteria bacterium]
MTQARAGGGVGRPQYTPMDTFPAIVADRARRTPDAILLRDVAGRGLSCAAFQDSVLTWAAALRRQGVVAGSRVVVMLPDPIDSLACWLGLAWLRAIETPVNQQFHGRMLAYVINDAAASHLVIAARFLPAIAAVAAELRDIRAIIVPDHPLAAPALPFRLVAGAELFAGVMPATELMPPARHDLSTMIYTSGTTGPSKGVLIPWGLWADSYGTTGCHIGPDDITYDPFPMFHTGGKSMAQTTIQAGGSVVLRESFRTDAFWDDIRRFGCTFVAMVPAMAEWLLAREPRPDDAAGPLRRVAMIPIIPRIEEFKARFGVQVQTNFGMTETGAPIGSAPYMADVTGNYRSCGRIVPAYEARIVDANDYDVADGEPGELVLRSRLPWGLNCGYFGRPEATATAWRNGWFHTGDVFRRDAQGNLYFVDRLKDALRRRGENVSSFEVEALVNAHPAVLQSAAIGVPSEFGEDEIKICVIVRPGADLAPAALLDDLATRMPRFMVPRYVEVVAELPRTEATLRVQKVRLRERPFNERTWDRQAGRYLEPPAGA